MNTTPPIQPEQPEERTARHLPLCAELADLGMQLARAAAAKTLAEWAEPEQPPTAEPLSNQPAEPLSEPAPTPKRTASTAPRKPTDPALLFTRLVAAVRDCIALEARLAAATTPAAARAASLQLRADPRRAPLRDAFRLVTENHPDRPELLRETTARLDEELAADETQSIDAPTLFFDICEELGIEIDFANLPDEYLDFAPEPHATSPPGQGG
jgi:hypothetical protein